MDSFFNCLLYINTPSTFTHLYINPFDFFKFEVKNDHHRWEAWTWYIYPFIFLTINGCRIGFDVVLVCFFKDQRWRGRSICLKPKKKRHHRMDSLHQIPIHSEIHSGFLIYISFYIYLLGCVWMWVWGVYKSAFNTKKVKIS